MKKELVFGTLMVAALAVVGLPSVTHAAKAKMYCSNECKGKSACNKHGNATCAGQNECKGKGYLDAKNAADCKKAGGKWSKDKS